MAKLYVVMAGLIGVVDLKNGRDGIVLLRRAEGDHGGHGIPKHLPQVSFREGAHYRNIDNLNEEDIALEFQSEEGLTIEGEEKFLKFEEIHPGKPVGVEGSCIGDKLADPCKKKKLVVVRVKLARGKILPIEAFVLKSNIVKVSRTITGKIVRLQEVGGSNPQNFVKEGVANAALFKADVEGEVSIKIGDRPSVKLGKAKEDFESIGFDVSDPAGSFLVVIRNLPVDEEPLDSTKKEHEDSHFSMFYDLLPQGLGKLVPVMEVKQYTLLDGELIPVEELERRTSPKVQVQRAEKHVSPGSQCINPLMSP